MSVIARQPVPDTSAIGHRNSYPPPPHLGANSYGLKHLRRGDPTRKEYE